MKHLAFLALAALLLVATSQAAGAGLITSKHDPAMVGATVVDFDDKETGVVGDTVTIRNVTFTDLDDDNQGDYSFIAFAPELGRLPRHVRAGRLVLLG